MPFWVTEIEIQKFVDLSYEIAHVELLIGLLAARLRWRRLAQKKS